jgi:pimeloyl-ACP methyl ester carboxylesterase/DNA-binding CsgD family transcriptional regulator
LFGHLAVDPENERERLFYEQVASRYTLVRYDRLGTGMSDRDRPQDTLTLEFEVDVLDALTQRLNLGRVSLFGFSFGGLIVAAFAARRPERVRRMLLYGVYANGAALGSPALLQSVTAVLRADWDLGSRLLAQALVPGADRETALRFATLRQEASSGEVAAALLELPSRSDIRELLPHVTAPTLVLHRSEDRVVPLELGRAFAALVPDACFEVLDGSHHQPWLGDSCAVLRAGAGFLGFVPTPPAAGESEARSSLTLTPRETEVLRLVAEGLNDATIAQRLVLSAHTVHRHVANIRARLGQPSRAAAAALAVQHGLI